MIRALHGTTMHGQNGVDERETKAESKAETYIKGGDQRKVIKEKKTTFRTTEKHQRQCGSSSSYFFLFFLRNVIVVVRRCKAQTKARYSVVKRPPLSFKREFDGLMMSMKATSAALRTGQQIVPSLLVVARMYA